MAPFKTTIIKPNPTSHISQNVVSPREWTSWTTFTRTFSIPTQTPTSLPKPAAATASSTDGIRGKGITCIGSTFGNCCSQYGYCGSTPAFCGTGCNPLAGTCSSGSPSSIPIPTHTFSTSSISSTSTPNLVTSNTLNSHPSSSHLGHILAIAIPAGIGGVVLLAAIFFCILSSGGDGGYSPSFHEHREIPLRTPYVDRAEPMYAMPNPHFERRPEYYHEPRYYDHHDPRRPRSPEIIYERGRRYYHGGGAFGEPTPRYLPRRYPRDDGW